MQMFSYGSVLKIQRDHSISDIRKSMGDMKQLGFNTVVIWPAVYWWEDQSHPHYPFHTGHQVLRHAEEVGLKVIMELAGQLTALEYAPDFLMKEEYYAKDANGNRDLHGDSYGYLNYNHPEVKQLVASQFTDAAGNYKDYPSLYGYDIWNETMFTSFDEHTLQLFRRWLKNKYHDLDSLNDSWDRVYRDWSHVQFTGWLWASVMPRVDYQQFHKDNIGTLLAEWREAIRSVDANHPVIADNVSSMLVADAHYDRPQDDWSVAENVDEFGLSFYPKNTGIQTTPEFVRWETFTGIHSASKSGSFWISELQTNQRAIFHPGSVVYPHELRWWNWEAISHGARGLIYWKWAPFTRGVQTCGRGLVDTEGEHTERAEEAAAIAGVIAANREEFTEYEPEQPKAAILYDRLCHDFIKAFTFSYEPYVPSSIYTDSIGGLYKSLWANNIPVKFVTPRDIINTSIDSYNVLLMSNQLNIDEDLSHGLRRYVEQGGVVICDGKLGEINDTGALYARAPGAMLEDITGFRLRDMLPDHLGISLNRENILLTGCHERRVLDVTGKDTDVIGVFDNGEPAIVQSRYGRGYFTYIATFLWYGCWTGASNGIDDFIALLDAEFGLRLHHISDNALKFCTLRGSGGWLVFVFNYGSSEKEADIVLQDADDGSYRVVDLYTQDATDATTTGSKLQLTTRVEGNGVQVLKVTRHSRIE